MECMSLCKNLDAKIKKIKMKFNTDVFDKPFLIDGTTRIEITFEIGDIFIDINDKVKVIKNIVENRIEFIDELNNVSFEKMMLSKEFVSRYRYAGTIQDSELPVYEDAFSLV